MEHLKGLYQEAGLSVGGLRMVAAIAHFEMGRTWWSGSDYWCGWNWKRKGSATVRYLSWYQSIKWAAVSATGHGVQLIIGSAGCLCLSLMQVGQHLTYSLMFHSFPGPSVTVLTVSWYLLMSASSLSRLWKKHSEVKLISIAGPLRGSRPSLVVSPSFPRMNWLHGGFGSEHWSSCYGWSHGQLTALDSSQVSLCTWAILLILKAM